MYRTLSQEEMRNINGGIPWKAIGKFLLKTGVVAAVEECVSGVVDWVRKRLYLKEKSYEGLLFRTF